MDYKEILEQQIITLEDMQGKLSTDLRDDQVRFIEISEAIRIIIETIIALSVVYK